MAELKGSSGKFPNVSVSEGWDNRGADVPANESEGIYTGGGGGHLNADSGSEPRVVLFGASASIGGIVSCSGNRGSRGGSERKYSVNPDGGCWVSSLGDGIAVSSSLSMSISDSEEYPN